MFSTSDFRIRELIPIAGVNTERCGMIFIVFTLFEISTVLSVHAIRMTMYDHNCSTFVFFSNTLLINTCHLEHTSMLVAGSEPIPSFIKNDFPRILTHGMYS